jgi:hypothetical protein
VSLRVVVTALLFVGCDRTTRVEGTVEIVGRSDHAGIAVRSENGNCNALTDANGAFAMDCRRGPMNVDVQLDSMPHFPLATTVDVPMAPFSIGTWALTPQPESDGLWWASDQGVLALPRTHLVRAGEQGEKSYCLDVNTQTDDKTVSPGSVFFIDQHAPPWKLFRLDDDGCAQRWRWHAGDWRVTASDAPEATVEHLPNALVHHFALPAGQYFVADWTEGRLTPERPQSTSTGEKRYLGAVIVVPE